MTAHKWDETGERCTVCGDKDWMGGPCSGPVIPPPNDTDTARFDGGSVAPVDSLMGANASPQPHTDDIAIERFMAVLKEKMAESRAKGRSGWEGCDPAMLAGMLREHVEKGDPRDVALLSMMLWWHSAKTNAASPSTDADAWWLREGYRGVFPHGDRRGWEGAAKYGYDAGMRAATARTAQTFEQWIESVPPLTWEGWGRREAAHAAWLRATAQQPTAGYCKEGENHCVCGGDLPRVREGCGNWVKGT